MASAPKVFLDTNVLLDLFLEREGMDAAAQILDYGIKDRITVGVSYLSFANIAYVMRKWMPHQFLSPSLLQLSSLVNVLSMDDGQLHNAIMMEGPDFEDVLQYACALDHGYGLIVTRNKDHFNVRNGLSESFRPIPIMSPPEFLAWLSSVSPSPAP